MRTIESINLIWAQTRLCAGVSEQMALSSQSIRTILDENEAVEIARQLQNRANHFHTRSSSQHRNDCQGAYGNCNYV